MKNRVTFGIIATVILIGGFVWFTAGGKSAPLSQGGGMYCQLDGTFSDTMPIQSHRSYCIKSDASQKSYVPNIAAAYSFLIIDDQGNVLKDLAITHTKPMHVIVVRKDLANFQHVHPEFNLATGVFTLADIVLPTDGAYRIFADFAPQGGQMNPQGMPLVVTLSEDVSVGNVGNYRPLPLGGEGRSKTVDGNQISLATEPQTLASGSESMMTFSLARDGKPITDLQEYLAALGHAVVLREGTLDFIHAHPVEDPNKPQNGKVNFTVVFPQSGKYKVFIQFQMQGKITTTDFVVDVAQGQGNNSGIEHGTDSAITH